MHRWRTRSVRGSTWKELYIKIMKTTLHGKESTHWTTTISCTNFFLCLKQWKYQMRKQQWTKNEKKLEKIPAWQLTKIRNKREVIDEARNEGKTVQFASLMDICHLKSSELEPQFQKYKGRVVLRGVIVKDDSGAFAVFTEQGSSASQRTAAKVMDVMARLPRCAGQTADAVSAYTQVKMEGAPQFFKNSKNRNVQTFGFVYHDTNGQNHGPAWKTQLFLLNEICTVILWQDENGKSNLRKSYCSTVGRRFPNGNACSYTVKKGYSYLCMSMTSNWMERNKILIRFGKYSTKKSIWASQHLSWTKLIWVALKENAKRAKILWEIAEM